MTTLLDDCIYRGPFIVSFLLELPRFNGTRCELDGTARLSGVLAIALSSSFGAVDIVEISIGRAPQSYSGLGFEVRSQRHATPLSWEWFAQLCSFLGFAQLLPQVYCVKQGTKALHNWPQRSLAVGDMRV
jgi:hypothetical protein